MNRSSDVIAEIVDALATTNSGYAYVAQGSIQVAADEANISVNQLGKELKVSQAALSQYNAAKKRIPFELMTRIADRTNKPYDFFLFGDEQELRERLEARKRLPRRRLEPKDLDKEMPVLAASISAGRGVLSLDEFVEGTMSLDEDAKEVADYLVKVEGDSMTLPSGRHHFGIEEGDIVGIRVVPPASFVRGDTVVAIVDDHVMIKEYAGEMDGHIVLHSHNPDFYDRIVPKKNCRIIGVYSMHLHFAGRRRKRRKAMEGAG